MFVVLEVGQWGWEDSTGRSHADRHSSSVCHSLTDSIRVKNSKQFIVCQDCFFWKVNNMCWLEICSPW